ncbi:hypothetical protein SAMN05443637_106133 [Pseudonocardia thermophila]|uniref:DUF4190 domain-containing protein n=1 Tax=Pseudonocardia thermophila TaxID=1848 RepID=A0A1M6SGK1_PSETH|nr:hypothetical protein [Pseudonocardia thermophila]SHK43780.1 hypothetical protein SAMN05443637_106133 [Pseudonocardia thermophila]
MPPASSGSGYESSVPHRARRPEDLPTVPFAVVPQQRWAPPPVPAPAAPEPAVNVAAYIALASGLLAMVILPILLGPVAIVAGLIGEAQSRKEGRSGQKPGLIGLLLGIVAVVIMLGRWGRL